MTPTEHKDPTRRQRSQNEMGTLFGEHTRIINTAGHGEMQKKTWKRQKMRSTQVEQIKLDHLQHVHACIVKKITV